MKKILFALFLFIYGFTFFSIFNTTNFSENLKINQLEQNLKGSYKILLPSEISQNSKDETYQKLINVLDKYNASIFFLRQDNDVQIKYVYLNDYSYFDNYKIEGNVLTKSDLNTVNYLSTQNNMDDNQLGIIEEFGGDNAIEIRTLNEMSLSDNRTLDGYCYVQLQNDNINEFVKYLQKEMGLTRPIEKFKNTNYDTTSVQSNLSSIITIFYIVILLLVLFNILKSYKVIGIKKLLGHSFIDMVKEELCSILAMQVIAMTLSSVLVGVFLFKKVNIYTLDFAGNLIEQFGKETIIIIFISLVPYIYINKITVKDIIKNKRNTFEIILFNTLIKLVLLVVITFMGVSLFSNYNRIKSLYTGDYKNWEKASNYMCVSQTTIPLELIQTEEFKKDNKNLYDYLNKYGLIYAVFSEYEPGFRSLNAYDYDNPYKSDNIDVNPNYLKENLVYDLNGKAVNVSDDNENHILLIPEHYLDREQDIRDYYKSTFNSYLNYTDNREIDIIWIKDNQSLFSYNIEINPDDGNMVKDPVINVITQNNSHISDYDRILLTSGNPVKIPLSDDYDLKETFKKAFEDVNIDNCDFTIVKANDQIASEINEVKKIVKYNLTGLGIVFICFVIIIIQNISNYYEQYKMDIFIKQFHGYKYFDKYKIYHIFLLITYLLSSICAAILIRNSFIEIVSINLFFMLVDIFISTIVFKIINKKKLASIIKGE